MKLPLAKLLELPAGRQFEDAAYREALLRIVYSHKTALEYEAWREAHKDLTIGQLHQLKDELKTALERSDNGHER